MLQSFSIQTFLSKQHDDDSPQGVYQMRNIKNNRIYIGSSQNIYRRWKDHINLLNKNKHHSYKLQYDWNKYGSKYFRLEIIELVKHHKDLFAHEQKYLDKFKPYETGYNISSIALSYHVITNEKELKKHLKKTKLIKSIEIERQNSIDLLNTKTTDNIEYILNIRHKDMTLPVYKKQSILYQYFPIYFDAVKEYITDKYKNELCSKIYIIAELRCYLNSNHHILFLFQTQLKDGSYIFQKVSFQELENIKTKHNYNDIYESIIHCFKLNDSLLKIHKSQEPYKNIEQLKMKIHDEALQTL